MSQNIMNIVVIKSWMSYYPEPHNHIIDKVKIMLDLSNYTIKKELEHATGVDTSNLSATKLCCFESWCWRTRP